MNAVSNGTRCKYCLLCLLFNTDKGNMATLKLIDNYKDKKVNERIGKITFTRRRREARSKVDNFSWK